MIVIRRMVDRHRAYTAIMLPGEPPRIFPTTDHEHARVLQIFKQDRAYEDIHNDFSDFALGKAAFPSWTKSVDKKARRAGDGPKEPN